MSKSDLEDIAALNRQIAELRSVLSALLTAVETDVYLPIYKTEFTAIDRRPYDKQVGYECHYCHESTIHNDKAKLVHLESCPYRRAKELTDNLSNS